MILKPFILTLILLATAAGGQRPNILFIAIDDLRPELGCYGATQVKTPHIDKLAASGMRFERAYCQVPICMGSRASLMTGILPTAKRFVGDCRADVDAPAAMTLPEAFRKAGYTTLSNGKIFHALDDAADRSWSEAPWLTRNNMRSFDPETTRRLSKTKQRGRIYELPDVADDAYPDGETAQKTIKDLQRLKQEGKPFFLACGFFKPHMPFYAPKTMHLAIRVPLIVKVPGKKPGASSSLVETTDLFPSLCALAGITAPATVQGRDFTALLDDPKKKILPRSRLQPFPVCRRRHHRSIQLHQLRQRKIRNALRPIKRSAGIPQCGGRSQVCRNGRHDEKAAQETSGRSCEIAWRPLSQPPNPGEYHVNPRPG